MKQDRRAERDTNRFRWIEKHKPLMEYHGTRRDLGWVVSTENSAESGLTLRTAIDKAMRNREVS